MGFGLWTLWWNGVGRKIEEIMVALQQKGRGWNKNQKGVFCKGINKKYILCFRVLLEKKWLILVQESKWDNEKQWLYYFCFTSVLLTDLSQSVWKEGRFAFKMYWPKLNLILVSIILPSLLIKMCGTKTENLHLIIFWTYGPTLICTLTLLKPTVRCTWLMDSDSSFHTGSRVRLRLLEQVPHFE